MSPLRRRPDLDVARGERVLAAATADGISFGGTRDAFYPGDGRRVPWEEVERATWNSDDSQLTVAEVGSWGEARREHVYEVEEPDRLLQLIRERVTASVVLQRHVPIDGARGVRVIARRPPRGGELRWLFEYDEGVDPIDPAVRQRAQAALAQARADVGVS